MRLFVSLCYIEVSLYIPFSKFNMRMIESIAGFEKLIQPVEYKRTSNKQHI